jgi:hypothetical protein
MKCDASNGYAGWQLRDNATNQPVPNVLWADPDTNEYCTADWPIRIVAGEIATTMHLVQDFTVDFAAMTFWFTRLPVTVQPLSAGRQQNEPSDKPCGDCCQPGACRRTSYCAAHRCDFGSIAP